MEENVTINSKHYQEKILCPIFTEDIPFLYLSGFHRVKFNQNEATSHISKSTIAFIED